jgi:hypothetical protein
VPTITRTRVHTRISLANPWLACTTCRRQVGAWHNPDLCGCHTGDAYNLPCGHPAGTTSLCMSWSPVDGCTCLLTHEFGAA